MKLNTKHIIFSLGVCLIPLIIFSQEDLTSTEEYLEEQQNINFQTFFFEALQQKAIGNFDKAIFALEACHNIDGGNVAVLFELSKNYSLLNKYTEAEYYILKGLEFDPTNIHMLRNLKEIKEKKNDYNGAINVQKQIVQIKPEEESELVLLYIKSGNIEDAVALLSKLDSINKLPPSLAALKESLTQTKSDRVQNYEDKREFFPESKLDKLKKNYNLKNDFKSLRLILETELKTKQFLDLLKDSEEAIGIYPAQPYVYLMNAVALNSLRKYKNAIVKLEIGLEYVFDDAMEAQFMEQLSLSYKGLGQNKIATSYYKKALDLRKNK